MPERDRQPALPYEKEPGRRTEIKRVGLALPKRVREREREIEFGKARLAL